MSIAIYPGSFDPITLGHLDILNSAVKIFNKVNQVYIQISRWVYNPKHSKVYSYFSEILSSK